MIDFTALQEHTKKLITGLMSFEPFDKTQGERDIYAPQNERFLVHNLKSMNYPLEISSEFGKSSFPAHPEEACKAVSKDMSGAPTLIVALSGGADSVFLLHLLGQTATTMPLTIIVAHLNHGWRDAADDADEQFCRNLAQQFNCTFITAHADEIATTKGWNGSQEELGRHQRHTFLQNTAKQFDACGIAFGHHAQDQEETFFIRLLRGASLEGLCGMY